MAIACFPRVALFSSELLTLLEVPRLWTNFLLDPSLEFVNFVLPHCLTHSLPPHVRPGESQTTKLRGFSALQVYLPPSGASLSAES